MADEARDRRALQLGAELKRVRERAGRTGSQIPKVHTPGEFYSDTQVSQAETGKVVASEQLVEGYVAIGANRAGLVRLRDAALDGKAATRKTERLTRVPEAELTADASIDEIRGCYSIDSVEHIVTYGERGVLQHWTTVTRIRCASPTVKYFAFSGNYAADQRRGVLTVAKSGDWSIARSAESEKGALDVVVELARPVKQAETPFFDVVHRFDVRSDSTAEPHLSEFVPHFRDRTAYRVQFEPSAGPQRIWHIRSNDAAAALRDPTDEQLLSCNGHGFYHCDFREIDREFVGLAWNWR